MIEYSLIPAHLQGDPYSIIRILAMRKYINQYRNWIIENKIEAFMPNGFTINFQHVEDLTAFKLKFGV